ncbi:SHOCT domain-containing protein, partial [Streptomyces tanashiensis]
GPVYESLTFAAAVLAAIRGKDRAPVPVPVAASAGERRDPGAVAERIRHLGELHQAGLVTDAEFSAKKAELLAEL